MSTRSRRASSRRAAACGSKWTTTADAAPVRRDATDEGGRGLTIVDTMSTAWGTYESQNGKTVWFELER